MVSVELVAARRKPILAFSVPLSLGAAPSREQGNGRRISSGSPWQLPPTLDKKPRMRVGALLGQADAIAKRKAAPVAAVDADEGPRMTTEGAHLLEGRVEHQLPQGDPTLFRQLHEGAASRQRDGDCLGVADLGKEGRLDVMGTDDEDVSVVVGAEEHAAVEARRRGKIASGQRAADLLLDHGLPGIARRATEGGKGGQVLRGEDPDQDLVGIHLTSGVPLGIAIVGLPETFNASGSISARTSPHAVP